jgi:2-amino-4-hydroxy-6-hydroxymethyldihydropteridine diphosphokinase
MNLVSAFIGIGSNIEPEKNVVAAVRSLCEKVWIAAISNVYLNPAENRPEQEPFYNCAVQVETQLSVKDLKRLLSDIEDSLGRKRSLDRYAARTIDLDILMYDDMDLDTDDCRIPDPSIPLRPFLAIPLAELASDFVLPGDTRRLADIAAALTPHHMTLLPEITEVLNGVISHEYR